MARITQSNDIVDSKGDDRFRYIQLWMQDATNQVNGGLLFGQNIKGQILSITFAIINTNTTVSHRLGFIPTSYIVIGLSASLTVYDGTISFTSSQITLKGSALGTARLFIF